MFRFIKKIFIAAMTLVGCCELNPIPLKCVSISNQECKVRPDMMNINSNESCFIFTVLLSIDVVVAAMTLKILMLNYKFLMLSKT